MIKKLYFLGPKGSYTQSASEKFSSYINIEELVSVDSIYEISQILKEGNLNEYGAIIPIENSIEGIVRESQDNLADLAKVGYRIQAETCLDIEHSLVSFGKKEEIKTIISHPQALAQCRNYIFKNWGNNIDLIPTLSTSNAVLTLKNTDPTIAAIASEFCAKTYNVPIQDSKINDEKNNKTRFVLLTKFNPKNNFQNKTSIVFSTENIPGALNKVLTILEKYGLNMSYIDSRPSRKELGEYVFYIDFAGHIEDLAVKNALEEIQPFIKMFEILSNGAEIIL